MEPPLGNRRDAGAARTVYGIIMRPAMPRIVDARSLNVSKAAEILKVRRATLSDLLDGKAALTPSTSKVRYI